MSGSINVRKIRSGDLPQLARLCEAHAVYEMAEWKETGQIFRWQSAFFSKSPEIYGWVADQGGLLVGFMTATVDYATWSATHFAHMDCLFIDAEFRSFGIGRRFFKCLEEFCRERKFALAQWQTPPDNLLGIGFYNRMGATSKPKIRFFYDCPPNEN